MVEALTLLCAALAVGLGLTIAWSCWREWTNPAFLVLLFWLPAVIMLNQGIRFVLPAYERLNQPLTPEFVLLLSCAYLAFSLGAQVGRGMALGLAPESQASIAGGAMLKDRDDLKLAALFLVGASVFAFAFSRTGLGGAITGAMAADDVFENRLAFHLGPINHLILLMDVAAILFLHKFFVSGQKLYALPAALSCILYFLTFQKSRILFLIYAGLFFFLSDPRRGYQALFGTRGRAFLTVSGILLVLAGLAAANLLRGIGIIQFTDAPSQWLEQAFIYSGAPAILNLAATLNGVIPADPPAQGNILFRWALWGAGDRDLLNPTRYLEGINNGTALIFYWWDFRMAGIVLVPALTGAITAFFITFARRRWLGAPFFGALSFYAVAMLIYTDVVFEALTVLQTAATVLIILFLSLRFTPALSRRSHSA